jgi:rhodanese-related sulfurtransferase
MNLIDRDELHEKLERHDEFRLVMALPARSSANKRIPNSLGLDAFRVGLEKLDRDEEIVVYCGGKYCPASIYAYYRLERAGFTHVRRYAGGIPDWEEAGFPLERCA